MTLSAYVYWGELHGDVCAASTVDIYICVRIRVYKAIYATDTLTVGIRIKINLKGHDVINGKGQKIE